MIQRYCAVSYIPNKPFKFFNKSFKSYTNMSLDFLSNASLIDINPAKKAAASAAASTKLERNPLNADIRIFKTGATYPSEALIQEFDLEYRPKDTPVEGRGTGFDVIDSREYMQYNQNLPALVLLAPVGKGQSKVDLFALCNYDKEGKPSGSVRDQGAETRGKELIQTLQQVYGLTEETMFGDKSYVDLRIIREHKLHTSNGIYNFPKKITRGERKGEYTYERRENVDVMPLLIAGSSVDPKKEEYLEKEGISEIPVSLKPGNQLQVSEAKAEPVAQKGPATPLEQSIEEVKAEQAQPIVPAEERAAEALKQEEAESAPAASVPVTVSSNPLADLI